MKRFIGLTVVSIIFCGGYFALKHILNTTDYYAKVTLENKTSSVTRSTPIQKVNTSISSNPLIVKGKSKIYVYVQIHYVKVYTSWLT